MIILSHLMEKILSKRSQFTGKELVLKLESNRNLLKLFSILKYHTEFQFSQLVDLYGVDYPSKEKRFELNYVLWSNIYNERLRVKVFIEDEEGVESLSSLYFSAGWLERECWDMFGIFFYNHSDLRRILTDYGFEGFPLRKDFPVTGFLEVRYDECEKKIIYERVELSQEYRLFHFLSPWEK